MRIASLLLAAALSSTATVAGAQNIYRCTAPDGTIMFSDHRCGPDARLVKNLPTQPPAATPNPGRGGASNTPAAGVQVNIDNHNSVRVQAPRARQRRAQPHHDRGMSFNVYRRLETGMSEGQVLAIAGPPDRETVDSQDTADGITRKSFYYFSRGYNAFVTRVEFRNGQVTRIERTPILGQ